MENYNTKRLFIEYIQHLDIRKGDVLFVSSDITNLVINVFKETKQSPDLNWIIDCLIEKMGPDGTILVPTYNWGFCKDITFDWKNTKSQVGVLGDACLKRPEFKRTKHPIYSFAVSGKDKDYLCALDYESSFGEDSVFGYLDKRHAKNLFIDVRPAACYTFKIYAEQMCASYVPYRFTKYFTADYKDENGEVTTRTYSMFVRHLDKDVKSALHLMEKDFLSEGLIKESDINGIQLFYISDMHSTLAPMCNDIIHNKARKMISYIGQNTPPP
jgi:aminoglycoside 3-N-acetyltransferase